MAVTSVCTDAARLTVEGCALLGLPNDLEQNCTRASVVMTFYVHDYLGCGCSRLNRSDDNPSWSTSLSPAPSAGRGEEKAQTDIMAGIMPPPPTPAPVSAAASAAVYDRWFQIADADRDGRVTGQDAVHFFERSGLPREVLAKVRKP